MCTGQVTLDFGLIYTMNIVHGNIQDTTLDACSKHCLLQCLAEHTVHAGSRSILEENISSVQASCDLGLQTHLKPLG